MSIGLLREPGKIHEVLDDYESVFWASLYGAVHFYEHEITGPLDLTVFDEMTEVPAAKGSYVAVGGTKKLALLQDLSTSIQFKSAPFNHLIKQIATLLHQYYTAMANVGTAQDETPCAPPKPRQTSKRARRYSSEEEIQYDPKLVKPNDKKTANDKLEALHNMASDPMTWLKIFEDALDMEGWATNDALGKDAHPPKTANEDLRKLQSNIRPSLATGAEIKAHEESSTSRHVSGFSRTGRYLSLNRTQIRCSTVRCCR